MIVPNLPYSRGFIVYDLTAWELSRGCDGFLDTSIFA